MKEFDELIDIIKKLRHPVDGCPWDIKQTSNSLVPNFIEELYEVIEAIEDSKPNDLQEELGDLLLHIVMQAEIAAEKNHFEMNEVINSINQKLIRRHPHIFGDIEANDSTTVKLNWERIKKQEKKDNRKSVLEGIPKRMPALIVAQRMQEKAASVGFDWDSLDPVIEKLHEELEEFKEACKLKDETKIKEEIGDLLFTIVNISRKMEIDTESALRDTISKFEKRFNKIEEFHEENQEDIYDSSLEKLDELWNAAKKSES